MIVKGIQCLICGDRIFGRARHDCRSCSCKSCFIDGGFDYQRIGGELNNIKSVEIKVITTRRQLFDDWYFKSNKFGLIKGTK